MLKYFPYKSDKPGKTATSSQKAIKKVYFGQTSASDFTLYKDEARKQGYINRHKENEFKFQNKSGIDTASFWSSSLLWEKTNS